MSRWTPSQRAAIEGREPDLLVSAAAGAGKTAVLTRRVLRRVADAGAGIGIDRLLVVTFTEAAATELRERVAAGLESLLEQRPGDAWLRRQLALLPAADVSTLHGFCRRVIDRHFYRLGVDPGFRVLDAEEALLLRHETLADLLERRLAAGDDGDFRALVEGYGGRDGEDLIPLVLRLYDFAATQPDARAWLDGLAGPFAAAAQRAAAAGDAAGGGGDAAAGVAVVQELRHMAALAVEQALWHVRQGLALCTLPDGPAVYEPTLREDARMLEGLGRTLREAAWDRAAGALGGAAFGRLAQVRGEEVDPQLRERVKAARDQAKKGLRALQDGVTALPARRLLAELGALHRPVRALVALVHAFAESYRAAKDAAGGLDFADLERYCLGALRPADDAPSPVASDLRRRYAEVLVDEYQDINPVQDAILALIAGEAGAAGEEARPGRFLVGDVRQSIYRFRLAEPGIFLARRRRYRAGEGAPERRVELQENFRSRPAILAAVNFVFRQLFRTEAGEVGYDDEAYLRPGLAFQGPDAAVELHLLERDPEELRTARGGGHGSGDADDEPLLRADEREAVLVARELRRLLGMDGGRAEPVWDAGADAPRPLRPGDVAVLMRSPRHRANTFVEVLREHGVPARADLRTGYFDALEVETLLSLLRVIDNPDRDIALATVLHAPLVGLDAADLARVRLAAPRASFYRACRRAAQGAEAAPSALAQRLRGFLADLERWRTRARRGPLGDLIWSLLQETGYLDYAAGMPGGEQRRANLERLLELARAFDGFARQGLERFLRFVDRLREEEADLGAAVPADAGDDAVQVLSVHRSKGLEFPVVFCVDLGRAWNRRDLDRPLLVHRRLGVGLRAVDPDLGTRADTAARVALRHRLRTEALAEEMRVLYVAMTRARERLYLIGSARDLPRRVRRWTLPLHHGGEALPEALAADADCFLDLLAMAIARHRHGRPLREAAVLATPPAHRGLFDDAARWRVRLWTAAEALTLQRPDPLRRRAAELPWSRLREGRPLRPADPRAAETLAAEARALDQRLQRPLPGRAAGRRPAKLSVSELKRRLRGRPQAEAESEEEPAAAAAYPVREWHPPRPGSQRADRPDSAEAGNAAHLVLRHLDLTATLEAEGVAAQVERMVERELLLPEQAALVPVADLAAFFASPLGLRMRRAPDLRRELPFSLRVPAPEVYGPHAGGDDDGASGELADQWVLVQGVIDALFVEDDGLVLVDFKTDRVGSEGARARAAAYAVQLGYYARAAGTVLRLPVREAFVALLAAREAIDVRGWADAT